MVSYLILNELHPDEQPGAATLALDYAKTLSQTSEVFFLHTSEVLQHTEDQVVFKRVGRRKYAISSGYLAELYRIMKDLFCLTEARQFLKEIKCLNPKVIWIHQIGNHIPRLLLPLLPSIAPVIMTVHDYSLIVPRKLYPGDLSFKKLRKLRIKFNPPHKRTFFSLTKLLRHSVYSARRSILRIYLRRVKIVCISEQQADIYRLHGYRVVAVIPNGIGICNCEMSNTPTKDTGVLFVGRTTGKGIDRLIASLSNSRISSTFAGGEELRELVLSNSKRINAHFRGKLSRKEVFQEIHKAKLVYLASDCFDVYPNIGIEAIRHGALPIVSDTTGVRDLVRQIEPSLVLDATKEFAPLETYLEKIELNMDEIERKRILVNENLLTLEQSIERYLAIIRTCQIDF